MNFNNPKSYDDIMIYREWLKENCGEEFLDWRFNMWKWDLPYGLSIYDPKVETLFKLKFNL